MKRTIIILIALILIVSLPVFASTPEEENAPAATSEDSMFMDLTQLSEEELTLANGNADINGVAGTGGAELCLEGDGGSGTGPHFIGYLYEGLVKLAQELLKLLGIG